ncbi:unnamed protein product [Urochloa decumbens]|uniref:DUF1618 domain-containing protein n=1 Tax=Urochloa decumbens TaxID=240449 RepID=A0ABC9DQG0_9POAL
MEATWVILRHFLGIVPKDTEAPEHPAAIFAALRAPPRVTILSVATSAHPDATHPNKAPYLRGDRATKLRRFFSGAKLWIEMDQLPNPLSGDDREWAPSGVVAHEGKLWFFDLSWGLISCDPNVILPGLRFHDLPPGRRIHEPKPFIHTIRWIGVSNQMLRYVDIARDLDLDDRSRIAEKKVAIWTAIPDPDGGDCDYGIWWLKTYEMSFREIWNDASYRETMMPRMIPEIVLVNPKNPNVVYFFLRGSLFGVDVPGHRVVGFVKDAHKLVAPGCRHCVLPWDLPPSIANGLVEPIVPFQEQSRSSTSGDE